MCMYVYVWLRALRVGRLWLWFGAKGLNAGWTEYQPRGSGIERGEKDEEGRLDVYTNGFDEWRSGGRVFHKQHLSFRICLYLT